MVAKYVPEENVRAVNAIDRALDRGIGIEIQEIEIAPNLESFNAAMLLKMYNSVPAVRKAIEQNSEHISIGF
jgi:hypothetical protein